MDRILQFLDLEKSFAKNSSGYKAKKIEFKSMDSTDYRLTALWNIGFEAYNYITNLEEEHLNPEHLKHFVPFFESELSSFEDVLFDVDNSISLNNSNTESSNGELSEPNRFLDRIGLYFEILNIMGISRKQKYNLDIVYPILILANIERVLVNHFYDNCEHDALIMLDIFEFLGYCRDKDKSNKLSISRHSSSREEKEIIWEMYCNGNYRGFNHAAENIVKKENITLKADTIKRYLSKRTREKKT